MKWDLGSHPSLNVPTLCCGVLAIQHLLSMLSAPLWGAGSWGMSQLLALHTCGPREPSQARPPGAASVPGPHWSQVLLSPRIHDKEGMVRPAVIGGLGKYNGGPSGRPHTTS